MQQLTQQQLLQDRLVRDQLLEAAASREREFVRLSGEVVAGEGDTCREVVPSAVRRLHIFVFSPLMYPRCVAPAQNISRRG